VLHESDGTTTASLDFVEASAISRLTMKMNQPVQLPESIEIGGSPMKMAGIVVLGLIVTATCLFLAWYPPGDDTELLVVGYIGAAFFGACTVFALPRVFTSGPVITITPMGICDRRVAADLIPWSAVREIGVWEIRSQFTSQRTMVLAIEPLAEAQLNLTPMVRWTRGANRALGADGLCIMAQGLKISFDELLSTSRSYWQASRSGAA
jgi:hypothetical protein